ncbi:MAG: WYL domain-containing protein [Firmicutes bacterium]|nr:WYL domain-containing protein [Bacillota bacterium]
MSRSANQKLKLLYLYDIMLRETDEEHPLSVAQIIEALAARGISAERKSIYDDLECLRNFGLDIVMVRGSGARYYVGSRDFELPELKLLVDSVQSSKFITHKKTLSLIKKIEGLTSHYEAGTLQRQVYVQGRVKSMNESVYYNVDEIAAAINSDRQISFRYFTYTVAKELEYRHNGKTYVVSPFAMLWSSENYYLLGWDDEAGMLKHYRVDKMKNISMLEEQRQGKEAFAQVDMSQYDRQVFSMFTGEVQLVKIRFANELAGAVIDHFGKDTRFEPVDGGFIIEVSVEVSPQFFAWVFAYGDQAEILSPELVRNKMFCMARQVADMY